MKLINKIFQSIYSDIDVDVHPEVINCGWCYNWAYAAYILYGGTLCSVEGHAFIKLNGRYFDAEALDGVEDWSNLPIFDHLSSCNLQLIQHQNDDSFWKFWKEKGASPDYEILRKFYELRRTRRASVQDGS